MRRKVVAPLFCVFVSLQFGQAIPAPTGLISIAGDKSVVLHWDRVSDPTLSGYHVYRSTSGAIGPFSLAGAGVLTGPGFCDISGSGLNRRTNFFFFRTVATQFLLCQNGGDQFRGERALADQRGAPARFCE